MVLETKKRPNNRFPGRIRLSCKHFIWNRWKKKLPLFCAWWQCAFPSLSLSLIPHRHSHMHTTSSTNTLWWRLLSLLCTYKWATDLEKSISIVLHTVCRRKKQKYHNFSFYFMFEKGKRKRQRIHRTKYIKKNNDMK